MTRLLAILCLLAAAAGCVTDDGLFRRDLSDAEVQAVTSGVAKQKERFATELRAQRAPILAKTATKPHLWRLARGKDVAYLIGTMHAEIAWTSFPFALRGCVSKASTVVFEVGDHDTSAQLLAKGVEKQLDASGPEALVRTAGEPSLGNFKAALPLVKPEVLERLPPTAAIGLYLAVTDLFIRGESACMDCEIRADALQQKKRLGHLEDEKDRGPAIQMIVASAKQYTLDDFRKTFAKDPFAAYLAWVKDVYISAAEYKAGRDDLFRKQLGADTDSPDYEDLIGKRNRLWAPRVGKMMAAGPTLFVVGTGHMVGPAALDKLLAAEGVTASRVDTCDE